MPDCEPAAAISTLITSFKPRQVILSSLKPNMTQQEKEIKSTISPTSEQKVLLYHSICQFLELNGFLKTLKKFRSETDVEKDSWKSCSLNLEEMCHKHLQMRNDDIAEVPDAKQKNKGANNVASVETVEITKECIADDGKKCEATLQNDLVNGDFVKSKKRKKSKSEIDVSNHVNGEPHLKDAEHIVEDALSLPSESLKKSKDKKKKCKHESEPSNKYLQEKQAEVAGGETLEKADGVSEEVKSRSKKTKEDVPSKIDEAGKERKGSKKRKKSSSDDNETGLNEETPFDESKRRKTYNSDQSNSTEQATKTPKGCANGVLEKDEGKKSGKQNKTKERNCSVEPKTSANAFQRVKPDEVEFVDERLQDNSYWAKDGAYSGYGAKAQEVLGQVRGRDFRHEKTKKKRGSYRGGQIDLQSHSVKFNYDDDDE